MTPRQGPRDSRPRFALGQIVATPAALASLAAAGVAPATLLARHVSGDWGDVCAEDAAENEFALGRKLRIFSVYRLSASLKLWVITEADRSVTTILLPDDY